jgi:hypothetical protein
LSSLVDELINRQNGTARKNGKRSTTDEEEEEDDDDDDTEEGGEKITTKLMSVTFFLAAHGSMLIPTGHIIVASINHK